MSGKLYKKKRRGSKSLALGDDDAENAPFVIDTTELSYSAQGAYDIPLESPRRSMLVPANTLYPPMTYSNLSNGIEMHTTKELTADDESSFEPLDLGEDTGAPLFGGNSARGLPISVQVEAAASLDMPADKERALLTSKNTVGGVLWRIRSESAWTGDWSLMDENKVRRWALKSPLSLTSNHTISNVETGAVLLSVHSSSAWTGGYDIYLGNPVDKKAIWAKYKPYSSTSKCAVIEFPSTDDLPLHVRSNAGSSRYRFYRGEHNSDYYTFFNFDNDKNLRNLVADVNIATWTEALKILVQPGQEQANMLPTLLFSVLYLLRRGG